MGVLLVAPRLTRIVDSGRRSGIVENLLHRLVGLPAILSTWASAACAVSWLIVLIALPLLVLSAWRKVRFELAIPAAIGLMALVLRVLLPWGPLNFVDAERLGPMWLIESWPDPLFSSVPTALDGLRTVGFDVAFLMQFWGPLFGMLAVVATYGAARTLGLTMGPAALAALVVACFPAHLHYSTGPILSVEAGALAIAALGVASWGGQTVWAPVLVAALTTLGVYTRPECRLLVLPVAILLLGPGWTWRQRMSVIGLLVLSLGAYVPLAISPTTLASPVPECMRRFAVTLAQNPLTFGLPWILAALLGLVWGAPQRRQRLALAAFLLGVTVTDAIGGSDPSPQWGQWRYFVVLVPFAAVAAAALVQRTPLQRSPWAMVGLFVLAAAPLERAQATLKAANDQQAAYKFVRETAHQTVEPDGTVYVLRSADTAAPQSSTMLALAAVFGPFEGVQWGCRFELPPSPVVRVRVIDAETMQCPQWIRPRSVMFLGPDRPEELLSLVRQNYDLVPLGDRSQRVVLDAPDTSTATCSAAGGLKGPTEDVRFGWYQLRPKAAPAP